MEITTEEAIGVVNNYLNGQQNTKADIEKRISAFTIVVQQLQGILDTPSQDMIAKQAELDAKEAQRLQDIATKEAEKEQAVGQLQSQITTLSDDKTNLEGLVTTLTEAKEAVEAEKLSLEEQIEADGKVPVTKE